MEPPSPPRERAGGGVRASIVAELVRFGVARGAPPLELLAIVDKVQGPDVHVPYAQANAVWCALENVDAHDPHGLRFGAASMTTFAALLAVTRQARTVRDALRTIVPLFSQFTTDGRISLHADALGTRLEIRHRSEVEKHGYPVEFSLSLLVRLVAGPHGADAVRRASFRHCPLGALSAYVQHIGPELNFESEANAIVFRDEALDRPSLRTDPLLSLHRRFERSAPTLSAAQAQIEAAVVRATEQGRFDLAATARELGLSIRTLQRQAKSVGVELRATLRAARHALAVELLGDRSLSLRVISERLDYADERSFSRAFERWTGVTPTAWRRSQS